MQLHLQERAGEGDRDGDGGGEGGGEGEGEGHGAKTKASPFYGKFSNRPTNGRARGGGGVGCGGEGGDSDSDDGWELIDCIEAAQTPIPVLPPAPAPAKSLAEGGAVAANKTTTVRTPLADAREHQHEEDALTQGSNLFALDHQTLLAQLQLRSGGRGQWAAHTVRISFLILTSSSSSSSTSCAPSHFVFAFVFFLGPVESCTIWPLEMANAGRRLQTSEITSLSGGPRPHLSEARLLLCNSLAGGGHRNHQTGTTLALT